MKKIFTLLVLAISINCFAQKNFKSGYLITDSGQKVNCLIKVEKWRLNPTEFNYKINSNSQILKGNLETIKAFQVGNIKYEKFLVAIDFSTSKLDKLTEKRAPEYLIKKVFLKTLIIGDASLYSYETGDFKRYFFKTKEFNIDQLIYKEYNPKYEIIAVNNDYKLQLSKALKDNLEIQNKIAHTKYQYSDLTKLFIKYNNAKDNSVEDFSKRKTNSSVSFSFKGGINSSSLKAEATGGVNEKKYDFGNQNSIRFGIEVELNMKNWGFFAEPTFNSSYTSETQKSIVTGSSVLNYTAFVNYTHLQVPIGIRYYIPLNENSKLFANLSLIYDFGLGGEITFSESTFNTILLRGGGGYSYGIGYKASDKFSIEARMVSIGNISIVAGRWPTDFKTISLVLGYRFSQTKKFH